MNEYSRQKKVRSAEYKKSIGKQSSLFKDDQVRRDYFKSQQWVEQHVKIKLHITGYATCYEAFGQKPKSEPRPNDSRPQGSLYSQQKHAIADAVEWIRRNSKYKPRIFVATTPGFIDPPEEGRTISKFIDNLKKTYGLQQYVWVRELTKRGYPHFHFIADIGKFDPVRVSLHWSSLFGSDAKNSVRLGSKPNAGGRRAFWVQNSRMAWYLSKYIGKDLDSSESPRARKKYRTFAISEQARRESQPLLYNSFIAKDFSNRHQRVFALDDEHLSDLIDKHGDSGSLPVETYLNPNKFDWKWTGHGQTFSGFLQTGDKKPQKKR